MGLASVAQSDWTITRTVRGVGYYTVDLPGGGVSEHRRNNIPGYIDDPIKNGEDDVSRQVGDPFLLNVISFRDAPGFPYYVDKPGGRYERVNDVDMWFYYKIKAEGLGGMKCETSFSMHLVVVNKQRRAFDLFN